MEIPTFLRGEKNLLSKAGETHRLESLVRLAPLMILRKQSGTLQGVLGTQFEKPLLSLVPLAMAFTYIEKQGS